MDLYVMLQQLDTGILLLLKISLSNDSNFYNNNSIIIY